MTKTISKIHLENDDRKKDLFHIRVDMLGADDAFYIGYIKRGSGERPWSVLFYPGNYGDHVSRSFHTKEDAALHASEFIEDTFKDFFGA